MNTIRLYSSDFRSLFPCVLCCAVLCCDITFSLTIICGTLQSIMNTTTTTAEEDGQWQTWRRPGHIIAFIVIFISIAIFAAVLTLATCLPLYSAKFNSTRLLRLFYRIRHGRRPRPSSASNINCDSWTTFGNLSSESLDRSLQLPLPNACAHISQPRPAEVWRPSMGSRLAWSFTSEPGLMSPVLCESSNVTVVEAPRTVLAGVTRALRRVSSTYQKTWGI